MRVCMALIVLCCGAAAMAQRPRVAVLPPAGTAAPELRERVAFSLRAKLQREGSYEPVPGIEVADAWGDDPPPTAQSDPTELRKRLGALDAAVFIFGQVDGTIADGTLTLAVWDTHGDAAPALIEKHLSAPTDLRFVSEEILQTLAKIKPFAHPSEEAVQHDEQADRLWRDNPNLAPNGGFDTSADWEAIYQDALYPPPVQNQAPEKDKIAIWTMPDGENVLAMNLSRTAAENNGLACLSRSIPIDPATRYRLQFRYKSDGPKLHVFVKGYTSAKNARGELVQREIYRRQVPPTEGTGGQWVLITDELNPQHQTFPVQTLRIDLYAYLNPGLVLFDDIVLKAVGTPTRRATDDAMDQPVTRPTRRP